MLENYGVLFGMSRKNMNFDSLFGNMASCAPVSMEIKPFFVFLVLIEICSALHSPDLSSCVNEWVLIQQCSGV